MCRLWRVRQFAFGRNLIRHLGAAAPSSACVKNPRLGRGRLSESCRIMSAGIGKCRFCNGSVGRETSVRIFPDGSYFFWGKKPFIRGGVFRLDFGRTGKTSFAGCPLMIEIKKTCNKRLHFGGGRVIKTPSLFSAALLLKPRGIESSTRNIAKCLWRKLALFCKEECHE